MRSGRAYTVAVVLVMAASLGAVSLAWGDPGAKSARGGEANPEPFPVGAVGQSRRRRASRRPS